jgi:hypothetical protein
MKNIFSCFAQMGAWSCLEEFNRIEVLSVIEQQMQRLLKGIAAGVKQVVFE